MPITLATLKDATAQEVFDQVVNHLKTQNAVSRNGSSCAYRNEQGLKCAAGCLIADDEYNEEMDSIETSSWNNLIREMYVPDAHAQLISKLQTVHDSVSYEEEKPFKKMELELRRTALRFNLEYKG